MDEQQRNLIIAVALSIAILLGFQYFFGQRPVAPPAPTQTTEQQHATNQPDTATTAPAATAAPIRPRIDVIAAGKRVAIDTPRVKGSINLVGARLDDLTLRDYHETADKNSPEIDLLSPDGTEHPYYVDFGWSRQTTPRSGFPATRRFGVR